MTTFFVFFIVSLHLCIVQPKEKKYKRCDTDEHMNELLKNNPNWANRLDNFEAKMIFKKRARIQRRKIVATIPVYFNVLYNNENNRVTTDTLQRQIDVLNKDFSGTNSDINKIPNHFKNAKAKDMIIRFEMSGNPVYKKTSKTFYRNELKSSATGGLDPQNPSYNVLNFWVAPLEGGTLGYAQFPGGPLETDGVVCDPGTLPGGSSKPYNHGRTATHEVGHWLNLRHIWGDDQTCRNTEFSPDFVSDTPAATNAHYGCPKGITQSGCNNQYGDMYMNFMDYVNDKCMHFFTAGQSDRIAAAIEERGIARSAPEPDPVPTPEPEPTPDPEDNFSLIDFINSLFFRISDQDFEKQNNICIQSNRLIYKNNLNKKSKSKKYIYGCAVKSSSKRVKHINDIVIVQNKQCPKGYDRSIENLNEGNNDKIYLCYKFEDTNVNSVGVTDIRIYSNSDEVNYHEKEGWIKRENNINPNSKYPLYLVFKRQKLSIPGPRHTGTEIGQNKLFFGALTVVVCIIGWKFFF